MKKMMALLMALCLMVMGVPAMAEDAAQTQLYTNTEMGFSIAVPAQWLVVDKDNIDTYIAAYENGEMTFTGTNADVLNELKPQFAGANMAVAISPYANNLVLTVADMGIELTEELFVSLMIPQFKQQIVLQMPTIEFTQEGEPLTLGENEFISLSGVCNLNGLSASVDQLFLLKGTKLYVANLTTVDMLGEEILNAFYTDVLAAMATFAVAE